MGNNKRTEEELLKEFEEELDLKKSVKWIPKDPKDYSEEEIKKLISVVVRSETQPVETKKTSKGVYPPSVYDHEDIPEGDDRRLTRKRVQNSIYAWYMLPKVTTDDEIAERTRYFFESCIGSGELVTVEKYAVALGYSSGTLREWKSGTLVTTPFRRELITKAFEYIHAMESDLVLNGEIDKTAYIFRAKNYFGMRDSQDIVISDNSGLGSKQDLGTIGEDYGMDNIIDVDFEEKD